MTDPHFEHRGIRETATTVLRQARQRLRDEVHAAPQNSALRYAKARWFKSTWDEIADRERGAVPLTDYVLVFE